MAASFHFLLKLFATIHTYQAKWQSLLRNFLPFQFWFCEKLNKLSFRDSTLENCLAFSNQVCSILYKWDSEIKMRNVQKTWTIKTILQVLKCIRKILIEKIHNIGLFWDVSGNKDMKGISFYTFQKMYVLLYSPSKINMILRVLSHFPQYHVRGEVLAIPKNVEIHSNIQKPGLKDEYPKDKK